MSSKFDIVKIQKEKFQDMFLKNFSGFSWFVFWLHLKSKLVLTLHFFSRNICIALSYHSELGSSGSWVNGRPHPGRFCSILKNFSWMVTWKRSAWFLEIVKIALCGPYLSVPLLLCTLLIYAYAYRFPLSLIMLELKILLQNLLI